MLQKVSLKYQSFVTEKYHKRRKKNKNGKKKNGKVVTKERKKMSLRECILITQNERKNLVSSLVTTRE